LLQPLPENSMLLKSILDTFMVSWYRECIANTAYTENRIYTEHRDIMITQ